MCSSSFLQEDENPIFSMIDYNKYQSDDFASDPSFRNWKLREAPDDTRFWTRWVAQNPDKRKDVEKATLLLEAVVESFDQISEAEVRQQIHNLTEQLDKLPDAAPGDSWPRPVRWWYGWRFQVAAAVLLGIISLGWWLTANNRTAPAPFSYTELIDRAEVPLTEFVNTATRPQTLLLPDGTTVLLQPGSKLSYQADFSGPEREVYLSGEGFFDVVRNPQRPFFVFAEQVVTQVLGTSFSVKANPGDDQIQVRVKTGRVSVYANSGNTTATATEATKRISEIVLTPNQKVVFQARENQFARSLVETPELLSRADEKPTFTFKGTPIKQVFETLEKAYGIDLIFDEEIMQNCYLTGTFTDETLYEKLDLITRTLNASYRQVDGQILILSQGC